MTNSVTRSSPVSVAIAQDPKTASETYLDDFLKLKHITSEDVSRFFQEKAALGAQAEQQKIERCYARIRTSPKAQVALGMVQKGAVVSQAIQELKDAPCRVIPLRLYFQEAKESAEKQVSVQIGKNCVFKKRTEAQANEEKILSELFGFAGKPLRATFPISLNSVQRLGMDLLTPLEEKLSIDLESLSPTERNALIPKLNLFNEVDLLRSVEDYERLLEIHLALKDTLKIGPDLSSLSSEEIRHLDCLSEENFQEKKTGKNRSLQWLLRHSLKDPTITFAEEDLILQKVFTLPWKVVHKQVETGKVYAEEFRSHVTAHDLKNLGILEEVLNELPQEDILKRIYCFAYQLLDNHVANIGFCIDKEVEEQFKGWNFCTVQLGVLSFEQFFLQFKQKKITETMFCGCIDSQNCIRYLCAIKDIPELLAALKTAYRLFIYDTGFCCAEDNFIQQMAATENRKYHLVPVRDGLLNTKYSEKPIPEAVIDEFLTTEAERQLRIFSWIYNFDHPFLRNLDYVSRIFLYNQIVTFSYAPIWTLSNFRKQKIEWGAFSNEMVATVFARHYATKGKEVFLQGAPQAFLERYGKESSQKAFEQLLTLAFPKMTCRQQQAHLARAQAIRTLFEMYRLVCRSKESTAQEKESVLLKVVNEITCPLSSKEKMSLRSSFEALLKLSLSDKTESIEQLYQRVLKLYTPTELSIAKVCYPLLADALEITTAYLQELGTLVNPGELIGHYLFPLEKMIVSIVDGRLQKQVPSLKMILCKALLLKYTLSPTSENLTNLLEKLPQEEYEDVFFAFMTINTVIKFKAEHQDKLNFLGMQSPSFFQFTNEV